MKDFEDDLRVDSRFRGNDRAVLKWALSPWLALALIPLAVNLVLWHLLYVPQRAALWKQRQAWILVEKKPEIETLLKESHKLRASWEPTQFSRKDPSAAVEAIQQMVGRYGLQIRNLQTQGSGGRAGMPAAAGKNAAARVPGFSTMPISLELAGSFNKLARWMTDVESQYGFQIDSWQITGSGELGSLSRMTVQVTAFLRDA